tara:strand:+ start:96 stop:335 length:240 start_codon:yes stop_codon:yes gene_type:complete
MRIKKLGASKTLLQFSDKEIFVSYETPVAARLKNGDCIRTEENHSRTTQKQITQYFSWVKDKSKIKNVSQSYLDNLLGA